MVKSITLIRHGESLGNKENKFTGWLDADLTSKGYFKAYKAGLKLRELNHNFDLCYTSCLKRAIKTTWGVLEGLNKVNTKVIKTLYLNERHYGCASGFKKKFCSDIYGSDEVDSWLSILSADAPPNYDKDDIKYQYSKIKNNYKSKLKSTESLRGVFNRMLKLWKLNIIPKLKLNKNILIVSHSNILKILISYLLKDYKRDILPNSTPMIIELNRNYKYIKHRFV